MVNRIVFSFLKAEVASALHLLRSADKSILVCLVGKFWAKNPFQDTAMQL